MPTDHSAADAAIREAVALAGGLPEGVTARVTYKTDKWRGYQIGPDRVTVDGKWPIKTQHFEPLKAGGYNVERIANAIRNAVAIAIGTAGAEAMIDAARELLGEEDGYDFNVLLDTTKDHKVNVAFYFKPAIPGGWTCVERNQSLRLERTCCTVDEIVAAVREAQALRGGQADE